MSPVKVLASVVLRNVRDAGGLRSLTARRRKDGEIVIEGQDLGAGVERIFGPGLSEYEWAWVIGPDAMEAAVTALGGHAATT